MKATNIEYLLHVHYVLGTVIGSVLRNSASENLMDKWGRQPKKEAVTVFYEGRCKHRCTWSKLGKPEKLCKEDDYEAKAGRRIEFNQANYVGWDFSNRTAVCAKALIQDSCK